MAQTSISIKSTERSGGKVANKSITFVNNEAENADLAALGEALCDLTTNNYVETNRVDKSNCDTEQGGGGGGGGGTPAALLDPNLSIAVNQEGYLDITFNGNGHVTIAGANSEDGSFCEEATDTIEGGVQHGSYAYKTQYGTDEFAYTAVYLESDGTYGADFAFYNSDNA